MPEFLLNSDELTQELCKCIRKVGGVVGLTNLMVTAGVDNADDEDIASIAVTDKATMNRRYPMPYLRHAVEGKGKRQMMRLACQILREMCAQRAAQYSAMATAVRRATRTMINVADSLKQPPPPTLP